MMIHLDLQTRRQLLHEITNGIYANSTMLPSENELCERLGVSRSTLRQAVTVLEQEHYLRRRQGIGTEIDRNVCSTKGRIDLNPEFSTFLSELGYTPRREFLRSFHSAANIDHAQRLLVNVGEPLLNVVKLWYADDHPAIWCTDIVPVRYIREPFEEKSQDIDIFTFLKDYCNQQISFQIASLGFSALDESMASVLDLPVKEIVVDAKCVGYSITGEPVLASREIYVPQYVSLTVLRSKI